LASVSGILFAMQHSVKFAGLARPGLLAAAAVTLWPLVYFYPAVLGRLSLVPYDGVLQNMPLRVAAFEMVRAGHLPLWNPYIFCGMPLHAAAQAGVLFPLNWFYLFLSPFVAGNLMTISAYSVAALGTYLYSRRAGAGVAGAALSALVFESCGFLVGQLSHINIVQTAAMLPWVLWALDGYGEGRGRKWGALFAVFVALQAFAGHQQSFAYSLILVAAYALAQAWAGDQRRRWLYLSSLGLLSAGVLLAAVQILPTYELLRNSLRSAASYDFFSSFSLPPQFLLTFVAPYIYGGGDGHFFGAPYLGPPYYGEFIAYVGVVALALAGFGAFVWRDARTRFWVVLVVAAYVLALGRHWPLEAYRLIHYVPLLNLFRVPARHLLEVDLALAVLAGRGLTALMAQKERTATGERAGTARHALLAGAVVFLLACMVVTIGRPSGLKLADGAAASLTNAPELFVPPLLAGLGACVLWLYARRGGRVLIAGLFALVALDLFLFGHATGWRAASPRPSAEVWRVPPPLVALRERGEFERGRARLLTVQHEFQPDRAITDVAPAPSAPYWLQPDAYMMHGAENAAGYEGFGLARYSRLAGDMKVWGELADPERSLRGPGREIDLLNVRYLLAPATGRAGGAHAPPANRTEATGEVSAMGEVAALRWRLLTQAGGVAVYENTRWLPRAWLAPEAAPVTSVAALRTIRTGKLPDGRPWDPLRTALVNARPGIETGEVSNSTSPSETGRTFSGETTSSSGETTSSGGTALVVRHEPNRIELKTEAQAPAVLVLAENYYPGWRAYLDGRSVEILRVNYAQRGVRVPAGTHQVVFVYRPPSVYGGLALTVFVALLLALWVRGMLPLGRLAQPFGRALFYYLSSRKR
jgi:hypothetical protein